MRNIFLEQLYTFGDPQRDPGERVITVAHYALIPAGEMEPVAASDTASVGWFKLKALPDLAFEHERILKLAHERRLARLDYSTIAFQFMSKEFTLSGLQHVYEVIGKERMDKRNFEKNRRPQPAQGHRQEASDRRPSSRHTLSRQPPETHRYHQITPAACSSSAR